MTIPRLADMTNYWIDNPPIHIAMSGILMALGGKRRPKHGKTPGTFTEQDVPLDKNGRPTMERPPTLPLAVQSFGGEVHIFKNPSLHKVN